MNDELDALAEVDRAGRIGRTTTQVGIPSALMVIAVWALRLWGVDLNPAAGEEEMPAEVVAAFVAVLTVVLAFRMNRRPPAEPAPAHDVVETAAALTPPPNVDPANPRH